MSFEKENQKSARMLIRRYVLDLIYQHPGEATLVPSYNVLKDMLGVAKSTAQAELNALRDEGIIITKVGVGSFTNPACRFSSKQQNKYLFSVIRGNGKIIYDSYYSLTLYANVIQELAKMPAAVQDVHLYSSSEDALFEELRGIQSDAIVWLSPPQEYKKIIQRINEVRPVLTVDHLIDGVSGIHPDLIDMGYQMGKEMLRRELRKPLILQGKRYKADEFTGLKKAYSEAGVPLSELTYICHSETDKIKQYFKSGKRPDSILFAYDYELGILEILKESSIDLENSCRMVSSMYKPPILNAPMLLIPSRFDWLAKETAKFLRETLEDSESNSKHRLVKVIGLHSGELL